MVSSGSPRPLLTQGGEAVGRRNCINRNGACRFILQRMGIYSEEKSRETEKRVDEHPVLQLVGVSRPSALYIYESSGAAILSGQMARVAI